MKTLTVRLPDALSAELDAEAERRRVPKSDIVRERLQSGAGRREAKTTLDAISDLIGSVDGLPTDLSARKKDHLRAARYGRKRPR
jgi:Arc/MetJ-type ribon-helix-helix transcriptional regulator